MAIGVPDNFNYGGKKPNFDRDQFETIKAMNEYPADYIDEGHISYCKEDKKHYKWNGSAWEEFQVPSSGGGGTAGMAISGTFNVATSTASQYSSIFSSMSVGDMRMYLVTDSSGNLPSTSETAVTVTYDGVLSPAFLYFGKSDNFGVSVGDILVFAKLNALTNVCRIIPLNDVKAANGDFPGADGLSTPWDKSRINKVDGIEWTANNNRDRLNALIPSVWKDNMNECLDTGVYPWCGTGRPVGSADGTHFTCVTIKSTTPDSSGYYTYWQTCFGREGADIGKVYQRVFFLGNGVEDNWGEGWKRVDNISLMSQLIDDVGYAKQSSVDRLSISKVDRTDNAPELTVGFANNLVGRGEATEETIVFRASGGDTSIEDGTARIERLRGNTVVWNQLVSGDGEITLLSNRKYLVNGSFNAPTEDTLLAVTSTDVVYDLSLMFGVGNEPTTIEEFNARKPIGIDEYAYNDGELISTNVDEVKSIGFNLLDVSAMQPNRMMPNGNVLDDTSVVHSDYVKVLPSSKYFTNMYCKKNVYTLVWFDEDKAVISGALGSIVSNTGKSVTSPSNAAYAVINLPSDNYDSSNFVFHLEHTGYRNGEYEPYKEFRRSLPISEIKDSEGNALFPNGLLSAGSVFDEITATKAIKRIGVVDMGSFEWKDRSSDTKTGVYSTSSLGDRKGAKIFNAYSTRYTIADSIGSVLPMADAEDKAIYPYYNSTNLSSKSIYLYDSSCADIASLKDTLSGVMLYYELEEPIEVDFPEPLNLDYEVSDFGTEEIIYDTLTTPLNADIIYQFNAVDRIRENSVSIEDLIRRVTELEAANAALVQQLSTNE